jgi:ankyrin repeat protein
MSCDKDHLHSNGCCLAVKHGVEQTLDEIKFDNSLHQACVYDDIDSVKKRIVKLRNENRIAEVNATDKGGYTALHYAARNGNYDICMLLVDVHANVNAKTFGCGSTPLHRAAYMCHEKVVQLFIEKGANVLEQDCDLKCALHKCVERGQVNFMNIAKLLIKSSRETLNIKDKHGKTPLDYCAKLRELI